MKPRIERSAFIATLGHWRWWLTHLLWPVWQAKFRYARVLRRLRAKAGKEKIMVLFMTGTPSKWKCQSLYDLLAKSADFEPCVCQTICDVETSYDHLERVKHLDRCREYYAARGMRYVEGYSRQEPEWKDLNDFRADIVFYNQQWGVAENQLPQHAARTALTFQVPYYVANNEDVQFAVGSPFQRTLFRFCALNAAWAEIYNRATPRWTLAGRIVPVGHTALDPYGLEKDQCEPKGYVIFAPHWSIDCPGNENVENYSTFLKSGRPMLAFAQAHPEIKWVFRPHPTLRRVLLRTRVWSESEIEDYYAAWAKAGIVSEGGGYERMFMESAAMITDCGSFLTEYACTGKPIVHLISSSAKLKPMKPSADLYATYYQVHDERELERTLESVVLRHQDPRRELRLAKVREAGLLDNYAARNIMKELETLLGIQRQSGAAARAVCEA